MEAKVKRALVFGSVPCEDWSFLRDYATDGCPVFCADGGVKNAAAAGFCPDFVVGDWDSGGAPLDGVPSVSLPAEKDMTDLQAALYHAQKAGCTEFLICGCLGGPRLDHTAFNLVILEWLASRGGNGILLDEDNEVRLMVENTSLCFDEQAPRYHYFSLVPLDRTVTGVTLKGAKYPLTDAVLTRGDTLSVSNEPGTGPLHIRIGTGRALLIRSQRNRI